MGRRLPGSDRQAASNTTNTYSQPIYSAHFESHGKERLATGGGDNNVRIWKITGEGEERQVDYLSTLTKHTQAVNVVRWAPKGKL